MMCHEHLAFTGRRECLPLARHPPILQSFTFVVLHRRWTSESARLTKSNIDTSTLDPP